MSYQQYNNQNRKVILRPEDLPLLTWDLLSPVSRELLGISNRVLPYSHSQTQELHSTSVSSASFSQRVLQRYTLESFHNKTVLRLRNFPTLTWDSLSPISHKLPRISNSISPHLSHNLRQLENSPLTNLGALVVSWSYLGYPRMSRHIFLTTHSELGIIPLLTQDSLTVVSHELLGIRPAFCDRSSHNIQHSITGYS